MRARSAVMGEEKSFREINPFVLGKGEKRLTSVRNSAWENLAAEIKDLVSGVSALAWPEHTDSVHPHLPLPTPAALSGWLQSNSCHY